MLLGAILKYCEVKCCNLWGDMLWGEMQENKTPSCEISRGESFETCME